MRNGKKLIKTSTLIDHVHFKDLDDIWDLNVTEINYIKQRNKDKKDAAWDCMYDIYKLGFAKGLLKAQEERKESNE